MLLGRTAEQARHFLFEAVEHGFRFRRAVSGTSRRLIRSGRRRFRKDGKGERSEKKRKCGEKGKTHESHSFRHDAIAFREEVSRYQALMRDGGIASGRERPACTALRVNRFSEPE